MSQLDSILQSFKTARKKINAFLRRQRWKEAFIFSLFVLMSFGFWLLQSLQQDYEMEIHIPVKVKNAPPNIAFNNLPPEAVVVRVKDKGSALLNYSIGRKFIPIELEMKDISDKSGKLSIARKTIESDIQKQLLASSTLLDFEPQEIEVSYSERKKKEVPVIFNGTVHTSPGFHIAGSIQISPETIEVYASEETLDTLFHVETVVTEFKEANKSITKTLALKKIDDATFEPTSVTINIPIEEFTEKTLEVPISLTDIPAQHTVRTFPSTVKVTCSIPLSRFKTLSPESFEIQLSYKDLEQNFTGVTPIQLSKQPEGVNIISLEPNKIEFIIEQNDLP